MDYDTFQPGTIEIGGSMIDPADLVKINPNDLDGELTKNPERFVHLNTILISIRRKIAEARVGRDRMRNTKAIDIYKLKKAGNSALTEPMVKAILDEDVDLQKASDGMNEMETFADYIQGVLTGLNMKQSALLVLARRRTEELQKVDAFVRGR